MAQETPTRRTVVPGVVVTVAGAAAGFAVASTSSVADPKPVTAAANNGGNASGGASTEPLAQLSDVPPNGGVVLSDAEIVLTRDGGDDVRGFSAVCTHQGCLVSTVEQGQIICACHGSRFDARTGEPVDGPAKRKLPGVKVAVRDNAVFSAEGK